jgi:hypothetical protein
VGRPSARLWAAVVLLGALRAAADDRGGRSSVDAVVPVVPEEHRRLHYFGRRDHHLVPGTVTINRAPYACDLDGKHFRERDDFVAHLRTSHGTAPDAIRDRLVVRDGVVHFVTSP